MILTMMLLGALVARPELTLAQGFAEGQMNPYAVGRAGEQGGWQVQPKIWGKVPKDLRGQQRQNERIMDELLLVSSGSLYGALRRYNGKGEAAHRYAERVMCAAIRVSILGRA